MRSESEFWRAVHEISPEIMDEAESLLSADKADLESTVDRLQALVIRLSNLVEQNVTVPRLAIEEGASLKLLEG